MRQFIRYSADIPIEVGDGPDTGYVQQRTQNISIGGLAFHSGIGLEPKTIVALRAPYLRPLFDVAAGRVAWSHWDGNKFHVGIQFFFPAEAYEVRMVEHLERIESYRSYIEQRGGRQLADEEAMNEWNRQHGSTQVDV